MPRLPKEGGVHINYRHIVGHLLRKPRAFTHYYYHESLFPRTIFRQAYDLLLQDNMRSQAKKYLEILNYAAITNEQDVAMALELLIEAKQPITIGAVKDLINGAKEKPPVITINHPNLAQYDQLIALEDSHGYMH